MKKGAGPYRVAWKSDGVVVGDRENIDKKAQAVSEAKELTKYIAQAIVVYDGKNRNVLTIEPVAR